RSAPPIARGSGAVCAVQGLRRPRQKNRRATRKNVSNQKSGASGQNKNEPWWCQSEFAASSAIMVVSFRFRASTVGALLCRRNALGEEVRRPPTGGRQSSPGATRRGRSLVTLVVERYS